LQWSCAGRPTVAASYYTVRLNDPKAVYLDAFGARGDGASPTDTDAIQRAIDKVQETVIQGIVFVPEGRYRVTKTIYVWPSIRLIGYGAKRPVFVLADNTAGYQDRNAENQMVFFAGSRPGAQGARGGGQGSGRPSDASPGTFYSAMSNIDIEIGEGNRGGGRARHVRTALVPGPHGLPHRIGHCRRSRHRNVMEDVRFFGGQYGIWTRTPSPSWQFTAVDAYFEGQREAAIREFMAGLTLIRPHFRNVRRPSPSTPTFPTNSGSKTVAWKTSAAPR